MPKNFFLDTKPEDLTVAAQKFLSCVKRTGERFGSNHLIDVIRGSKAKKVLQFGHQKLSTYGIGEDYSKKQWQQLARQFLHMGLMLQDMEFGSLKLTGKGWDVLRGDMTVRGQLEQEVAPFVNGSGKADDLSYDGRLFEILRKKRKELADESGVPPYVIFSDKTLVEMAVYFPQSSDSLLDIHGLGAVKYVRYGDLFLDIIRMYCRENQIEERPKRAGRPLRSSPAKAGKLRHVHIGEIFNSGRSIREIMDIFDIKQTTVIDHLFKYVMEGFALRCDEIFVLSTLTADEKNAALKAFDQCGSEYLKPVFDVLNGAVSYDDLKILRLYYLIKNDAARQSLNHDTEKMPLFKDIICLANSRKYSGHCIAGKEIVNHQIGNWIRPVSNQETGELSAKEISLPNGKIPELLDIISVPLRKYRPQFCQRENFTVDQSQNWIQKGALPASEVARLCDDAAHLWINGYHSYNGRNDRIPLEPAYADLTSSLLFIKPDRLTITVEEGSKLLKKVRAKFDFKSVAYWLTVTDPVIENRYIKENIGEYPVENKHSYLCVSIGEPHEGYRYKLVAGIIMV